MSKEGFVYILKSNKNGTYYIGSTENINNRYEEHCNARVTATKYLLPIEIVFYKKYPTIKEARQIEYKLKKFKSRKIIERIINEGDIKMGL
jgi:putative endonuclease